MKEINRIEESGMLAGKPFDGELCKSWHYSCGGAYSAATRVFNVQRKPRKNQCSRESSRPSQLSKDERTVAYVMEVGNPNLSPSQDYHDTLHRRRTFDR